MVVSIEDRVTALERRYAVLERIVELVAPAHRLVMSWPVGDITRRTLLPWWSAVGYCEEYRDGQFHTGEDLNLAAYKDSGAEVYACADGIVRFAGRVDAAWLSVVVIEHRYDDGRSLWSRSAHIDPVGLGLLPGVVVTRGALIGHVADYGAQGPAGDHLHFDLSWIDLGAKPADWPGKDKARVLRDYASPLPMILGHLP